MVGSALVDAGGYRFLERRIFSSLFTAPRLSASGARCMYFIVVDR